MEYFRLFYSAQGATSQKKYLTCKEVIKLSGF